MVIMFNNVRECMWKLGIFLCYLVKLIYVYIGFFRKYML